MSSHTATSQSGWSGRGRTPESNGGPAFGDVDLVVLVEAGDADLDRSVHRVLARRPCTRSASLLYVVANSFTTRWMLARDVMIA